MYLNTSRSENSFDSTEYWSSSGYEKVTPIRLKKFLLIHPVKFCINSARDIMAQSSPCLSQWVFAVTMNRRSSNLLRGIEINKAVSTKVCGSATTMIEKENVLSKSTYCDDSSIARELNLFSFNTFIFFPLFFDISNFVFFHSLFFLIISKSNFFQISWADIES